MAKAYEVHITKIYIVEAKSPEDARAKAQLCMTGSSRDFEFGGEKMTTLAYDKPVRKGKGPKEDKVLAKDWVARYRKGHQNHSLDGMLEWANVNGCELDEAKLCEEYEGDKPITRSVINAKAFGRNNRNVGKEQEHIDFSASDNI